MIEILFIPQLPSLFKEPEYLISVTTRTQETFWSYTANLAIVDVSNAQRDVHVKRKLA
jgi:hypothetical protein